MVIDVQISVIIPVFNCENYIEECLASVCRQSLKEIEIICIDDGSTDWSYDVMQKYSEKDHRVHVLRQINQGAGKARNLGLKAAKGDFVIFLDGDDFYIDSSALEKMYDLCVAGQVKVCGSNLKLLRQGKMTDDPTLWELRDISRGKVVLDYEDYQFDYGYTGFLFERRMLLEHKIEFPNYKRFQDPPFMVKAMYAAGKFVFSTVELYCYRVPTMASRFDKIKTIDLLKGLRENLLFAYEHNLDKLFQKTLMRLEYEYYSIICHLIDIDDKEAMQLLKDLNSIARNGLQQDDYMIRPLAFLLNDSQWEYDDYGQKIQEKVNSLPYIYIYGAGGLAGKFISYLRKSGLIYKVRGIIVSKRNRENTYFEGVEITSLDELEENAGSLIFIATGAIFHQEIINNLKKKGISDYYILDSTFLEELKEDNEIIEINNLKKYDNIVIYGAGMIAREVCFCLKENPYNLVINNFIVSDKRGNPESIFGIPVIDIFNDKLDKEKVLVLIAVMDKYCVEIEKVLKREGYSHYISLTFESKLWGKIREKYFSEQFKVQGKKYLTLKNEFRVKNKSETKDKSIRIYRAQSHVDKVISSKLTQYDWETPIQVGTALTNQRICELCDNAGENISVKNKEYCELTALYWIWKNDSSKYAGLCHYRRHFDLNEELLNEIAVSDIDVVLTVPILNYPSVREMYLHDHLEADWDVMMEAIEKLHPKYKESAEKLQEGVYYYGYNMFIAKKEILDAYCQWLFPVLFYCEERCGHKEDIYQNRYIGFLAERLLSIYFLHNESKYKIVHVQKDFLT